MTDDRKSHRAAVEAGYASLPEYIKPAIRSVDWGEAERRARLFDAAPDMLTALQHLLDVYSTTDTNHWSAWDYARAAIEKATGVKQ